jgi:hypothetical protein
MKKSLVFLLFNLLTVSAIAQDSTHRVRAVGLDVFQGLPLMAIYPFNVQRAIVIEPSVYLTTRDSEKSILLSAGCVNIKQSNQDRLIQTVSGIYVKFGAVYKPSAFYWGYNSVLSCYTMNGIIKIKGNYFSDFQTDIPSDTGLGIGAEFFAGLDLKLSSNLSLRTALRNGCHLTQVGAPASFYVAGGGLRNASFVGNITLHVESSIQLVYTINPPTKKTKYQ